VLSEFEFITKVTSKYGLDRVGDDCAILPKNAETDLLITSDLLVENLDFRLEWTESRRLGHKSLAVSLSDIAAMGGRPTSALLSLGVPEAVWDSGLLEGFYEGWHALAASFAVELVGGDVSRSQNGMFIDSIVLGEVPRGRAILRSGAKPGDGVFVAGALGGAAGGLTLLENGFKIESEMSENETKLLEKQLKPMPQLHVANLLQEQQLATAMIDVSDGLSSDLAHICRASNVGARIIADRLPFETALSALFSREDCLEMALNGGEDFALVFTGDEEKILAAYLPEVTQVGEITANTEIIELIMDGVPRRIPPQGYRHF